MGGVHAALPARGAAVGRHAATEQPQRELRAAALQLWRRWAGAAAARLLTRCTPPSALVQCTGDEVYLRVCRYTNLLLHNGEVFYVARGGEPQLHAAPGATGACEPACCACAATLRPVPPPPRLPLMGGAGCCCPACRAGASAQLPPLADVCYNQGRKEFQPKLLLRSNASSLGWDFSTVSKRCRAAAAASRPAPHAAPGGRPMCPAVQRLLLARRHSCTPGCGPSSSPARAFASCRPRPCPAPGCGRSATRRQTSTTTWLRRCGAAVQ